MMLAEIGHPSVSPPLRSFGITRHHTVSNIPCFGRRLCANPVAKTVEQVHGDRSEYVCISPLFAIKIHGIKWKMI